MLDNLQNPGVHNYVIVARAGAALRIPKDQGIGVDFPIPEGKVTVSFRSRYIQSSPQVASPGDLWIDVRGQANSLTEAIAKCLNTGSGFLNALSLSGNAAVESPEIALAYDNTPGLKERDYVQSLLPDEQAFSHDRRPLNMPATEAIFNALMRFSTDYPDDMQRLMRSIAQYSLALQYWRWGFETLAVAHLYMGVEALTRIVIKRRLEITRQDEEELARSLGINPDKLEPCQTLSRLLEARVRKHFIFADDKECYRRARQANDGFEHGFMPFDDVRMHSREVRDRTATYLRVAIFEAIKLPEEHKTALLNKPFDQPVGYWPMVKYIYGRLIGEGDNLTADGSEYPILDWKIETTDVMPNEAGGSAATQNVTITVRTAEGISFRTERIEVWRP